MIIIQGSVTPIDSIHCDCRSRLTNSCQRFDCWLCWFSGLWQFNRIALQPLTIDYKHIYGSIRKYTEECVATLPLPYTGWQCTVAAVSDYWVYESDTPLVLSRMERSTQKTWNSYTSPDCSVWSPWATYHWIELNSPTCWYSYCWYSYCWHSYCWYSYCLWWAVCFKIVDSKMLSLRLQIAIISTRWSAKSIRFVPHLTRSSEVECTCIDSIVWKSSWFVPRSTRFYDNRVDSCHVRLDFMKIELIRATFDSIIHGGENRLDSHSGENIHNGDTRTKINSIFTLLAFGIWEQDWTCTLAVNMYMVAVVILQGWWVSLSRPTAYCCLFFFGVRLMLLWLPVAVPF